MYFFAAGQLYGPDGQVYEARTHDVGTIRYFSQEHFAYLSLPFTFLMMAVIFPCYLILKPLIGTMSAYYEKERCDAVICCNGRVN